MRSARLERFTPLRPSRAYLAASIIVASLAVASTASASTFTFNTDPFAGTTVLTTPGRQVVGGEDFITFNPATDVFALDSTVFGVGNTVLFANAAAQNLPSTGVNVVVLESFDDDNNLLTPFGAGNAANLIAQRITTSGPGFFVYFNQGLNLPRLVFSTDLERQHSRPQDPRPDVEPHRYDGSRYAADVQRGQLQLVGQGGRRAGTRHARADGIGPPRRGGRHSAASARRRLSGGWTGHGGAHALIQACAPVLMSIAWLGVQRARAPGLHLHQPRTFLPIDQRGSRSICAPSPLIQ